MKIISKFKDFIAYMYYARATGNIIARRYNDAFRKINKAIRLNSDEESELLFQACLGECYMRKKEYLIAVEVLSKTVSNMEQNPEVWSNGVYLKEYSRVVKCLEYSESILGKQRSTNAI